MTERVSFSTHSNASATRAHYAMSVDEDKHLAYQEYLFDKEEWSRDVKQGESTNSTTIADTPFLIMELNRLVPYLDEHKLLKFHVLNMPHMQIGRIEIVGMVAQVNTTKNDYLEFIVEDGTGVLSVSYKRASYIPYLEKRVKIDGKYSHLTKTMKYIKPTGSEDVPIKLLTGRPAFCYPKGALLDCIANMEDDWWAETQHGLLGKTIGECDYVQVHGYCCYDFGAVEKPKHDVTFDYLSLGKLTFIAMDVNCIGEAEYNRKLLSWMNTDIRARYELPLETR